MLLHFSWQKNKYVFRTELECPQRPNKKREKKNVRKREAGIPCFAVGKAKLASTLFLSSAIIQKLMMMSVVR